MAEQASPLARWLGRAGTMQEYPRYLCVAEENYHRTCLVTHFPQEFAEGALAALARLGFPLRAAVILNPAEFQWNALTRAKLRRLEATTDARAAEVGGVVEQSEVGAAQALRHFRNQRVVGDLWFTVTVSAPDEFTLDERVRLVQNTLRRMGCAITWLGKEQEPGVQSTFVLGDPLGIQRTHQGWLVDPAAVSFALHPAVGGTLDDGCGAYFGHRAEDGSRVAFDLQRGVWNRNILILGAAGEGKSTFLKTLVNSLLAEGWRVIVFDVDGEYRTLARKIGAPYAAVIDQTSASGRYYDPLRLLPPVLEPSRDRETEERRQEFNASRLQDAKEHTLRVIGLISGGLSAEEFSAADRAIAFALEEAGVVSEAPETWGNGTRLHRWYWALGRVNSEPARQLQERVRPYFEGSMQHLFTDEGEDFGDAQLTVIYIGKQGRGGQNNIGNRVESARLAMAINYAWNVIRRNRVVGKQHMAVGFEEGQRLLLNEEMSDYVNDTATGARKWNALVALALNVPNVLWQTTGGQGLWDNSAIKVLFWMEESGFRSLAENAVVPKSVLEVAQQLRGSHAFVVQYAERGWDVLRLQLPEEELALFKTRGLDQ